MRMERVYPYFCPLVSYTSPLRNERPMRLHFLFQLNREAWEKKEREGRKENFSKDKRGFSSSPSETFFFSLPAFRAAKRYDEMGSGIKARAACRYPRSSLYLEKKSNIFLQKSPFSDLIEWPAHFIMTILCRIRGREK